MGGWLGIPWRVLAGIEGLVFLAILLLAFYLRPIWLAIVVMLGGFMLSGLAWIAIVHRSNSHLPAIAKKVPKT